MGVTAETIGLGALNRQRVAPVDQLLAAGEVDFDGPEEVLDYVVWHEACHLVVMDHSRRFWSLLARHRPDYRGPQRWLRANGTALVLPG